MSKIIVIGDIHNHWAEAEAIASKYDKTHSIVFTGDYFDDFGDSTIEASQTAHWLKGSLQKPNRIHLMGNHDINYSYLNYRSDTYGSPQNIYNCSGYSIQKDDAVNRIMSSEDWDKIKFYHYENSFLFTHAGIHPHWFECPIRGVNIDYVKEKLDSATIDYHNRISSDIIGAAGRCRGGSHKAGGILWCDYFREARLIPKIRQVFGHTPTMGEGSTGIEIDEQGTAVNINIDCGLSEVLEIHENGGYHIIQTGYPNFYYQTRKEQLNKK